MPEATQHRAGLRIAESLPLGACPGSRVFLLPPLAGPPALPPVLWTPQGLPSWRQGPRNIRRKGKPGGASASSRHPPPRPAAPTQCPTLAECPRALPPGPACLVWPLIPSGASPWGRPCVRSARGHMWLPGLPPRPALLPPPQPPSQACQEDVGRGVGGCGEASAWLLEKPRICSKCKQRVIFSPLPPTPGGVDTFDIGGTGRGWG